MEFPVFDVLLYFLNPLEANSCRGDNKSSTRFNPVCLDPTVRTDIFTPEIWIKIDSCRGNNQGSTRFNPVCLNPTVRTDNDIFTPEIWIKIDK